ncbi:outer membrane efflux protein [Fibrisoma limi BUZ 3]|uniref:Outer membrane efflux protein n=1 Tax=Fibrisoma limi BUZ 3 TaxID=1185876 RepID=I2GF18_9BACT|nr:TolC family protein [Fibrisoma limi]CCH52493.1 outer membrane efflux protein [Fibrisoma limi BUZ 3]
MKTYLTGFIWLLGLPLAGQPTITLRQCYEAARTNYPLLRQTAILEQTKALAIATLNTNRQWPQVAVNGQASWQSDVTRLPIELPNVAIPVLSKDQYKLTLDATYPVYDGNLTRLQTDVQRASTAAAQQQIDVELNRLNDQVNAYFLNALLTDENRQLTQTLLTDLRNRIEKLRASVRFGTAAQMNVDGLQAEVLRAEQRLADLNATRRGLRDGLQILTNLPITDSTQLVVEPPAHPVGSLPLNRPELALYQSQRSLYDAQLRLADNRLRPRFSLFAQGGFGRPALNFLDNTFKGFFIGGLRLNWNLSAAYTIQNERQTLRLNQQTVDVQQATFEKNLALQLRQQQTEIDRLQSQLEQDAAIVDLRTRVRQAAAVQLDNGVIAARDYTTELNNENQALLNQKLHELQLLQARIQYRTLIGN